MNRSSAFLNLIQSFFSFRLVLLLLLLTTVSVKLEAQTKNTRQTKTISGIVFSNDTPIAKVNVSVVSTDRGTVSSAKGIFSIEAAVGDTIRFSYVGMETVDFVVEDVTKSITINMILKAEKLDEVVVSANEQSKANSVIKPLPRKLRSAYGLFDIEKTAFEVIHIPTEYINQQLVDFKDAIIQEHPSLRRGALWDVDGQLFNSGDDILLDPSTILDIAVVTSNSGLINVLPYRSPVVVIVNTKTFVSDDKNYVSEEYKNQNYYEEDAQILSNEDSKPTSYSSKPLKQKAIKGTITHLGLPVKNASIFVVGSDIKTRSNPKGKYKIKANIGDNVRYTFPGYQSVEVIIEDITETLNIDMNDAINELDEVVVSSYFYNPKKQAPNLKSNKIENAYGEIDLRAAGYGVNVVDGKDLSEVNIDLARALVGKIPGYRLGVDDQQRDVAYLKPSTSLTLNTYAIWDVDGMILETPPLIPLQDIAYVAAIKSAAGTVRYGSIGAGGVIVVKTKVGSYGGNSDAEKFKNNSFYQGGALSADLLTSSKAYFKPINELTSAQEFDSFFNDSITAYENDPWFYITLALTVDKKFRSTASMTRFLSLAENKFNKNPEVLKAIGYCYQQKQMHAKAIDIFEQVGRLRPDYAQSYRDLANAQAAHGQYLMAWRTYMSYLYHGNSLGNTGIGRMMHREMESLIHLHKDEINSKEQFVLPKNLKDISNDVRLVFEWSSGEAEFDLEFVAADKRSFIWNHEYLPNKERINEEKELGYSSQEFVIEKINMNEDWLINLTYFGNKTNKPCLLKLAVYNSWGTPDQKETIYTYQLDKKDLKVNLLGFRQISKEGLPQQLGPLASSKRKP